MSLSWFDRKKQALGEWSGFIEQGVRFEGKLKATGTFRVDGVAKGSLASDEMLILGEHAEVEGDISALHVRVAGRFEGKIQARDRVEIQTSAVVTGEVHTPCLVIEAGAAFDGNCHILDAAESSKPITIPIRSSLPIKVDA